VGTAGSESGSGSGSGSGLAVVEVAEVVVDSRQRGKRLQDLVEVVGGPGVLAIPRTLYWMQ